MDSLLDRPDSRLREWKPETANDVRQRVVDIIDLADQDALDLLRSREFGAVRRGSSRSARIPVRSGSPIWDLRRRRGRWLFYPRPDSPRALAIYVPPTTQNRLSPYSDQVWDDLSRCGQQRPSDGKVRSRGTRRASFRKAHISGAYRKLTVWSSRLLRWG
jgi:hypothetical protein